MQLRGDHDSGSLMLVKPIKKDCKLNALLRFRVKSGDGKLDNKNSHRNVTYIRADIQIGIIQTFSDIVTKELIYKINNTITFSFIADKTIDISSIENIILCIRYVEYL